MRRGSMSEGIPLLDVVIQHCGKQVICRTDCVKIARKVKVDILHRNDLCISAARGAALDAENGTK